MNYIQYGEILYKSKKFEKKFKDIKLIDRFKLGNPAEWGNIGVDSGNKNEIFEFIRFFVKSIEKYNHDNILDREFIFYDLIESNEICRINPQLVLVFAFKFTDKELEKIHKTELNEENENETERKIFREISQTFTVIRERFWLRKK